MLFFMAYESLNNQSIVSDSSVQCAHDIIDQTEVHSNIKKLKCRQTAAVATIVDADAIAKCWTYFYRDLLGTAGEDSH